MKTTTCCPTCKRAMPRPRKPKKGALDTPQSRFWREAFTCFAFGASEWTHFAWPHAPRFEPRDGDRTMRPYLMSCGTTTDTTTTTAEQIEAAA